MDKCPAQRGVPAFSSTDVGGYLALNLYVNLPVRCMSVVFSEKSISLMSTKRIAETNGLGEALKYFCPVTIFINPSQCCTNMACHLKVDGGDMYSLRSGCEHICPLSG